MNTIMIRIKHDGKCRKISAVPKTIEELKTKITELFGTNAAKMEVTYKDCDGELVSVVDTEDLKNCIEEAETFKMTCVTLLLKTGGRATRSVSSKKSAQNITETDSKDVTSGSDEEHDFEVVGKEQKINLKLIEEKQKAEAEIIKQKLIEEHQKALAALEIETSTKIDQIHKMRKDRKNHSVNKGEVMKKQQKFMMKIRCMNQFCNAKNIENPILATKRIFKEIKEEFPELACNPALLNLILSDAKDNLINVLKTSCKKVIAENPEVAKAGEENREKFSVIKNKVREMGPCGRNRHNESSADNEARETRRAAKMAMIAEFKNRKHCEKEAKMFQKEAGKAEKHAKKAEEKQEKHQNKPVISDQEKAIRAKVTALKEIFTNAKRPHLRAIVVQNLNLSAQDLVPMIKASKLAKSN